jgi:hypothetical protein
MSRTVILWAGSVDDSFGFGYHAPMLGEPDGLAVEVHGWAKLRNFRGRSYRGLSALLEGVIHDDAGHYAGDDPAHVRSALAAADVIAFEGNGLSTAPSGGWESCDWYFTDSVHPPVSVRWDELHGALGDPGRDPRVVANGSIYGPAYSAFFGFPETVFREWVPPESLLLRGSDGQYLVPSRIIVSFLLFRLRPEIDTADPSFTIRISPTGLPRGDIKGEGYREGSPDPDAIGILACHHGDDEPSDHK